MPYDALIVVPPKKFNITLTPWIFNKFDIPPSKFHHANPIIERIVDIQFLKFTLSFKVLMTDMLYKNLTITEDDKNKMEYVINLLPSK